jgi:hypothetical protein
MREFDTVRERGHGIESINVRQININSGVCRGLGRMAGMKTSTRTAGLIAAASLLTACGAFAGGSAVTPAMVGHWEGNAHIIVSWCHQKNLPVKVEIQADGSVTGSVGDAKLTAGRFGQNRGWLGRRLNLATDYIIAGDLDGPLVAAEGITRERVKIPLNFNGSAFQGGVNTSGSNFGGKASMWLAARSLELVRSP